MRAVLQRVAYASVKVDGKTAGSIDRGILALVGMNTGDNQKTFEWMLNKLKNIRIFEDSDDKMNLSIADLGYGLLLVPNFTIYADARKGNRPSFAMGAKPDEAREGFNAFVEYAKRNYDKVESGVFQADMKVELLNDGPITILLDSDKLF
ncbi:MAG: D-aminoacyl-tRNA deacylase [Clostridia bacterium]|nr:D-aminoacyl-tRNA deacylase [Clostridia bacterium]